MTVQLPDRARARLSDLEDSVRDVALLAEVTSRRIGELGHAIKAAPNAPAHVANMEHELSRHREKLAEQQRRHQDLARIAAACRHWLQQLPANAVLKNTEPVRIVESEHPADAVADLRKQIAAVLFERRKIEAAAPDLEEMKTAAARYVDELAQRGTPRIVMEHERFGITFGDGTSFTGRPDLPAIIAWLQPETLKKRLVAEMSKLPSDRYSMSKRAKADGLTALNKQLQKLEATEEAYINAAFEKGLVIERRVGVSPAAVLGVAQATKAAASAA